MTLYKEHIERERKGEEVDVQVQKRVPEQREWLKLYLMLYYFLLLTVYHFVDKMKILILNLIRHKLEYSSMHLQIFKRNPRLKKSQRGSQIM